MAFLDDLFRHLLGGQPQQHPQAARPAMPVDPNMAQHIAAGQPIDPRRNPHAFQGHVTEDSLPVNTPQGRIPLSSVNPGTPWQNPQNGFSPMGYQATTRQPQIVNPGYPANFPKLSPFDAPVQNPTFDLDRENEILRLGGFNRFR